MSAAEEPTAAREMTAADLPRRTTANIDLDADPLDPNSLRGELSRLETAIVQLDTAVMSHAIRLDSVLKDDTVVGVKRDERDHATELAMRVRRCADQIEDIADNVHRFTNRIDL